MFTSTNPTDINEVIATVPESSATEILTVLRTAKKAQKGWAKLPAPTRGRIIANVGRLVENNKEILAKLITKEMGKVYSEALGEVQEVVDTCDFFLGEGRRLYGQTVPSEMQNKNLFTFRMPVGNVFVITAGNFPTAVPSWYIVPALLAGNTVVWKPSEFTPAVANALTEIFHAGGVPKDVLITVVADGAQTFAALDAGLKEGVINKVGFTGSTGTQGIIGFTGSTGTQGSAGYTGSAGTGYTGSSGVGSTGPKISSVTVTDSSYNNLDDTAVALTGGYIKIAGSGFESGCQVLLGSTLATSVSYISSTEVNDAKTITGLKNLIQSKIKQL